MNNEQQTQQADDPSGDGWAWVAKGDTVREGDMWRSGACSWCTAERVGETVQYNAQYRRRIEPQQPSDSETETIEDLRRQLAACEMLLAEAGGSGEQVNAELQQLRECFAKLVASQEQITKERDAMAAAYHDSCIRGEQVNAELQQLREQVATLTRALKTERDNGMTALRSQHRLGQEALAEALQAWLRPVLELVAEQPEDASPLAVAVLGFLPGIASRLIEE